MDDAVAESFNSTLKTEYVYRRFSPTRADARRQIGAWIDQFYNHRRRHSRCGGVSPHSPDGDSPGGWTWATPTGITHHDTPEHPLRT